MGISGPDRLGGSPPGSVGTLLASTELRVVDPETPTDAEPGEPGELWVRGPQVRAGYLVAPEATAGMLTADGWLRTGDLGRIDADGHLYVLDRLKELIKVNALQVAPAELEALVLTHPAILDAAVIPRPDERTGEVPVAVIVAQDQLDPDALMAWVGGRVASHKRIRAVRVVMRFRARRPARSCAAVSSSRNARARSILGPGDLPARSVRQLRSHAP